MNPELDRQAMFEATPIGIFKVGADGRLRAVNPYMARMCGYECPQQMLAEAADLPGRLLADRRRWKELIGRLPDSSNGSGVEFEIYDRNGAPKWVRWNMWAVGQDSATAHYEGTAEDVTLRRSAEEKMKQLAYRDPVTGLPNRVRFEERLGEAIEIAGWNKSNVALLLLEVSRFKRINDPFGKVVVDGLLKEIAQRIRQAVDETVTVARLEGSRFAILLEELQPAHQVRKMAGRIMVALSAQFTFLGHSFHLSPAMGLSIYPGDGRDEHTLLLRAELALYSARESGACEIQFFSEEMDSRFRERVRLETSLMLALERNEFTLVYQPQVDIRTGGISGLEALLRWHHPELGLVLPGEFIGVAESSGLIILIGEWVLRTACMQARKWQDLGLPAVPVAVNVSAVQLRHEGFCELVRRILRETGLEPGYLELELTEGNLLRNADVLFLFQELRDIGVKLTIDDFGTGYSSFSYLRQFKVNRLKIDQSFVREVPENADDVAIMTAILNMGRALELDVLAEGVENARQLEFLRMQDCRGVQGFYISNPVAAEQVQEKFQNALIRCA